MGVSSFVEGLARWLAYLGGVVLFVVSILTVVSVIGRAFIFAGLSPIAGDYELVEALSGFAVFCFLPICQLRRGHVIVDLFTNAMGPRLVRWVDALSEIIMAIVLIVIAWRLTLGFQDKLRYGETSFIRQFPIWWPYFACLFPAYAAALTGVYTSALAVRSVVTGRDLLPEHQGVE